MYALVIIVHRLEWWVCLTRCFGVCSETRECSSAIPRPPVTTEGQIGQDQCYGRGDKAGT